VRVKKNQAFVREEALETLIRGGKNRRATEFFRFGGNAMVEITNMVRQRFADQGFEIPPRDQQTPGAQAAGLCGKRNDRVARVTVAGFVEIDAANRRARVVARLNPQRPFIQEAEVHSLDGPMNWPSRRWTALEPHGHQPAGSQHCNLLLQCGVKQPRH
jgi:hypothetical protein